MVEWKFAFILSRLTWNQDINLSFLCRYLEWLWCFCRSLPGLSVAEQHCVIPLYLCSVSERLWFELMSNFAVELIGTEVFTWSPPSEADVEGDVQLVDDCECIALVPFSTTPARPIKRCSDKPLRLSLLTSRYFTLLSGQFMKMNYPSYTAEKMITSGKTAFWIQHHVSMCT